MEGRWSLHAWSVWNRLGHLLDPCIGKATCLASKQAGAAQGSLFASSQGTPNLQHLPLPPPVGLRVSPTRVGRAGTALHPDCLGLIPVLALLDILPGRKSSMSPQSCLGAVKPLPPAFDLSALSPPLAGCPSFGLCCCWLWPCWQGVGKPRVVFQRCNSEVRPGTRWGWGREALPLKWTKMQIGPSQAVA